MDVIVLKGPKTPEWACSCGYAYNWASRLRCRDCGNRCPARIETAARKAHKDAQQARPRPGGQPRPRGAWAERPWVEERRNQQQQRDVHVQKQLDDLTAALAKAKTEALNDLKEELKRQGGGEQLDSCVDAVAAKYAEQPKPKSLPALQGQRKKLEAQHQRAKAKVGELEELRAQLDTQIAEAKESEAAIKTKLETTGTELESRQATEILGDGLKGLSKVLEQFKATAVENQAMQVGLSTLQELIKKEQEALDAAAAAAKEPPPVDVDGNADNGRGKADVEMGMPDAAKEDFLASLLDAEDKAVGESVEQRRKRISKLIDTHIKRPRL